MWARRTFLSFETFELSLCVLCRLMHEMFSLDDTFWSLLLCDGAGCLCDAAVFSELLGAIKCFHLRGRPFTTASPDFFESPRGTSRVIFNNFFVVLFYRTCEVGGHGSLSKTLGHLRSSVFRTERTAEITRCLQRFEESSLIPTSRTMDFVIQRHSVGFDHVVSGRCARG